MKKYIVMAMLLMSSVVVWTIKDLNMLSKVFITVAGVFGAFLVGSDAQKSK